MTNHPENTTASAEVQPPASLVKAFEDFSRTFNRVGEFVNAKSETIIDATRKMGAAGAYLQDAVPGIKAIYEFGVRQYQRVVYLDQRVKQLEDLVDILRKENATLSQQQQPQDKRNVQ